jgi:hypothetical protein
MVCKEHQHMLHHDFSMSMHGLAKLSKSSKLVRTFHVMSHWYALLCHIGMPFYCC